VLYPPLDARGSGCRVEMLSPQPVPVLGVG